MYLSVDLQYILNQMENPIAKDFLNLNKSNNKYDISYIDIHKDKNNIGKVTFLNSYKYKEIINNNYNVWNNKKRSQPTKIGKIIKKIFNDKYNLKTIESFTNEFKSKTNKNDNFRIVYGEEIAKWYLEENYSEIRGVLGNSCMKYKEKNHFMKLYSENGPDNEAHSHVGMLILTNDNNKLLGRSIIWFNSIKPIGRTFMDRIYTINEWDSFLFMNYAIEKNWLFKYRQTFNDSEYIDPINIKKRINRTLSFRIKPKKFSHYPYLDTLKYYTPKTGRISSSYNNNRHFNEEILQSQNGIPNSVNRWIIFG